MNYTEAVTYMENLSKFGSVYGLDVMRNFLERLQRPDLSLKFIHVAGTNGKGSVCAYLTKILTIAGYKVGTFNSPSVFSFNERFLINGKSIDDDTLADVISYVKNERDKMQNEGIAHLPTEFELEVAIAMILFKQAMCDVVILETGMGGRLDATNVIENNLCSIITSISLEHTQYLGNTLSQIATEKFGIVKKHLITFDQGEEINKILKKAPKIHYCQTPELIIANLSGMTFKYGRKIYKTQMLGTHQLQNAALAIATCRFLKYIKMLWIPEAAIKKGIFLAQWAGRCEKLKYNNKIILIDGAHNPSGAKTLKQALDLHFPKTSKSFVFGVFKDKDVEGIIKNMSYPHSPIHVAAAPSSRGLDISSMKNICENYFSSVITEESISSAIDNAFEDHTDIIVVFGSLSILKEAKNHIRGKSNEQR